MGGGSKGGLELRDSNVCVTSVCVCVRGVVARIWIGENNNLTNTNNLICIREKEIFSHILFLFLVSLFYYLQKGENKQQ